MRRFVVRSVAVRATVLVSACVTSVGCGNSRSPGSASASTSSAAPSTSQTTSLDPGDDGSSILVVSLDGAPMTYLETDFARPIEDAVRACPGVASMQSRIRVGRAEIAVSARIGADTDGLLRCVRERTEELRKALPSGLTPEMRRPPRPAIALVTFDPAGRSADAVGRDIARLRELIEPIPGVTDVRVCGPTPAIVVDLDPSALRAMGLSPTAVLRALEAGGLGSFGDERAITAEEVGAIEVASPTSASGGAPVRSKLVDVASVRADAAPGGCRATSKSGEAIAALEVRGQPRAGARVASAIEASDLGAKVGVRLAGVDARITAERVQTGPTMASGDGSTGAPRDPDGKVGLVALHGVADGPLALWLAPPAETPEGWWIGAGARVAPPSVWTWRSVEEPSGGKPARSVWVALAGGAGEASTADGGLCVGASKTLSTALGDVALAGSVRSIGQGAALSGKREVRLSVDRTRATDLGASVPNIAGALRLMQPMRVGSTVPDVWVRMGGGAQLGEALALGDAATWLGRIDVETSRGLMPLASLVQVAEGDVEGAELARLGGRRVLVVAWVGKPDAVVPTEAWIREKVGGACSVVAMGAGEF